MRQTNLFIVYNFHWTLIKQLFTDDVKDNFLILRVEKNEAINQYAILSNSDKVDELLMKRVNGTRQIKKSDILSFIEQKDSFSVLAGNESILQTLTADTSFDINSIKWVNFSTEFMPDGKRVFFILCETREQSESLYEFMKTNRYNLRIKRTEPGFFEIIFATLHERLWLNSEETLESHPNLIWLLDDTLGYIGFGTPISVKENGDVVNNYFTQALKLQDKTILN